MLTIKNKAKITRYIDKPATNNWQKKVAEIKTVIPKSGCNKVKTNNIKKNNSSPFIRSEKKVGRNDPCPCGSGKKYKHCCGKLT